MWSGAFREATLLDEDPVLKDGSAAGEMPFPKNQDGHFTFRVSDPRAAGDGNIGEMRADAASIVVRRPKGPLRVTTDSIRGIAIAEAGDTGVFSPAAAILGPAGGIAMVASYILVSNRVDDEQSPGQPDGSGLDFTVRARLGEEVALLLGRKTLARASICKGGEGGLIYVPTRITIVPLAEPFIDSGYGPDATGRGDGKFSYDDANLSGTQEPGEACEPVPPDRDYLPDGLRTMFPPPPGMDPEGAAFEAGLVNAALAQACMELRTTELKRFLTIGPGPRQQALYEEMGIFVREPPGAEPWEDTGIPGVGTGAGNTIFDWDDGPGFNGIHEPGEPSEPYTECNADGWYDPWVDTWPDGLDLQGDRQFVTAEQRSLMMWRGDRAPATLDLFVVWEFEDARQVSATAGVSFIHSAARSEWENTSIVGHAFFGPLTGSTTARHFSNTAHEVLHVLMDEAGHVGDDQTNLMWFGAEGGTDIDDAISATKRMNAAQVEDARTEEDTAPLRRTPP